MVAATPLRKTETMPRPAPALSEAEGTHDPRPLPGGEGAELHHNGRRIRSDALPEHLAYQDGGCDLSPECLRCPLERCRYDEPGGARRIVRAPRDEALRRRRGEGVAIKALASEFGLSRRTVFRVLARGRGRNQEA